MPELIMSEPIPLFVLYAFVACTRTMVPLPLTSVPTFTAVTYASIVTLIINSFSCCGYTNMPQVYPCGHVLSCSNDPLAQNGWSRIARPSVRALWLIQVRTKLKTSDWRRQGTRLKRVEKIHELRTPSDLDQHNMASRCGRC
jgi:hypothetical protein